MGRKEIPVPVVVAVIAAVVLIIGVVLWKTMQPSSNSFSQLSKEEQLRRNQEDAKHNPHRNFGPRTPESQTPPPQ
jgi:hypothetical protein